MRTNLKIARKILRKKGIIKGILSLIEKSFKRYIFQFFYFPIYFIKQKNVKYNDPDKLIDFVFNDCCGYLAPQQVKGEITSLLKYVKKMEPKTVMEIGTAGGGTLFLFSKVVPKNSFIVSLDLPGGKFGGGYPLWKIPLYKSFAKETQTINLVRKNSHEKKTLQEIKAIFENRQIDFLFIDGDHTYEGVKKDFELYGPLVRAGGTIAFHDILVNSPESDCNVNKFWNEIKKKYEYKEFADKDNLNKIGIGLIKIKELLSF